MKYFIVPILFLVSLSEAFGQTHGYGQVGLSVFGSEKFQTDVGANVGIGIGSKDVTAGASFDLFAFDKKRTSFGIASLDIRAFFSGLDKPASPFFSVQTGMVVVNNTSYGVTTKGSFAFAFMAGARVVPVKHFPGLLLSVGYSNISFKTGGYITHYGGLKLNFGFSF